MRAIRLALMLVLALAAGGCQTVSFYTQAVGGQFEIWRKARPIERVVTDNGTGAPLRERLQAVARIREFASRELALPDNGSYRAYADLGRRYVVWNVFAAPALSLEPRQWCFPVAGCVAYRGYFSEADAEAFAARQRAKGDDVAVLGVPAYSTLGWFDDPVLSTFIGLPEVELAGLIFHELAHQVAYVDDDTVFNESFAVTVELAGVDRWLSQHGTPAQREAWAAGQERKRAFLALAARTRGQLDELYSSDAGEAAKRNGKAQIFAAMRADYARLKAKWGGFSGYDAWLEEPLNNATLVPLATYSVLVPGFQALLADQGGDLERFYAAVKALAGRPPEERRLALSGG